MVHVVLSLLVMAGSFFAMRLLRYDKATQLILLCALAFYYFHFYHTGHYMFGVDYVHHESYVRFIAEHMRLPLVYEEGSGASYHSPLYYVIAAVFYKIGMLCGMEHPIEVARHFSIMLFTVFLCFSSRILQHIIQDRSLYCMALALLAFWPVGVTMSSRVHNDLLLYVGQIGAIYYWSKWLIEPKIGHISAAFWMIALTCLAKLSGVVFLILGLLFLCWALWQERHEWKRYINAHLALSILAAFACYHYTEARHFLHNWTDTYKEALTLSEYINLFVVFDPLLFIQDTVINPHVDISENRFWHWFLRSLILGSFITWHSLSIVFVLGIVWMCMLVYTIIGLCVSAIPNTPERRQFYWLFFVAGTMVASLIWMRYIHHYNAHTSDARYIYPIVTLIVLAFAKVMEWQRRRGRELWVQIGRGLAFGFILASLLLFIAQHVLLSRVYEGGPDAIANFF